MDDPETHIRYRLFSSLLAFVHRIGESPENVAAVIDLMHLSGKDKSETVAINYFLANREFLFFASDELWTAIGDCYCGRYATLLKPVGFRFVLVFVHDLIEISFII